MKQSPAPTTSTPLLTSLPTSRPGRPAVVAGLVAAVGLCLVASFGTGAVSAGAAPSTGAVHHVSTHGSGIVVAGGFEWGSARGR